MLHGFIAKFFPFWLKQIAINEPAPGWGQFYWCKSVEVSTPEINQIVRFLHFIFDEYTVTFIFKWPGAYWEKLSLMKG